MFKFTSNTSLQPQASAQSMQDKQSLQRDRAAKGVSFSNTVSVRFDETWGQILSIKEAQARGRDIATPNRSKGEKTKSKIQDIENQLVLQAKLKTSDENEGSSNDSYRILPKSDSRLEEHKILKPLYKNPKNDHDYIQPQSEEEEEDYTDQEYESEEYPDESDYTDEASDYESDLANQDEDNYESSEEDEANSQNMQYSATEKYVDDEQEQHKDFTIEDKVLTMYHKFGLEFIKDNVPAASYNLALSIITKALPNLTLTDSKDESSQEETVTPLLSIREGTVSRGPWDESYDEYIDDLGMQFTGALLIDTDTAYN